MLSLSTMYAQQPQFVEDMHLFVDEVERLGYDAIEVSHSTPEVPFLRLLAHHAVTISSIHAPAPLVRDLTERANSSLNLAALDDDERNLAIIYSIGSIEYTKRVGGKFCIVHLGGVGNPMFDDERELRRLWDSGTKEGERVDELRAAIIKKRAAEYEPWLEKARDTLRQLAEVAERDGVAIGIENRLHYHEIPQPDEAAMLLADYPPQVAGYWHDVGHAEVQWRLGLVDKHDWLDANSARCIGTHLHDVDGLADHRAPGNGTVEWDYLAAGIPKSALKVFEINQSQPRDAVANAIPFLREQGVI